MTATELSGERLWATASGRWSIFFVVNLLAMIATVVVDSFAHALARHLAAGRLHDALVQLGLAGVPARRRADRHLRGGRSRSCCCRGCSACRRPMRWRGAIFPASRFVMLLFLLPLLVPPITYGIPLATVLYQSRLGGNDVRASSSPISCRPCRSSSW